MHDNASNDDMGVSRERVSDKNKIGNRSASQQDILVARVLLLGAPFDRYFDYACPKKLYDAAELKEGDLLLVPFGKNKAEKKKLGVLWGWRQLSSVPREIKLKTLTASMRQDVLALEAGFRDFLQALAEYTMTRRGLLLQSVFAPLLRAGKLPVAKPAQAYRLSEKGTSQEEKQKEAKKSAKRAQLLALLAEKKICSREYLLQQGITPAVLRAALKLALIEQCAVSIVQKSHAQQKVKPIAILPRAKTLNEDQQKAAQGLIELARDKKFVAVLLDGQTGSGKTEVYFEAIANCLLEGKQALLLLPEIALSLRFTERFRERFGFTPLLYHSAISAAERREVWRQLASGQGRAVLGARSALFLPFQNLGVIVVDEEHDSAYKQEEGIVYHARDMAVLRAQKAECLALLASATPSLESWNNAHNGKYRHIVLPSRFGSASLPAVKIVDMLQECSTIGGLGSERFLTPILCTRIEQVLSRGEQALIFLNRRGYAPLLLCGKCGERLACRHCRAFLVEHRARNRVICHHCDFSVPIPRQCPSCKAEGAWKSCGIGIERLAEALRARFPSAILKTLSSDTTNPREVVQAMENRACDILLGTQMLAKGYHFPHLTLVAIVDADLGLSGGDPRAFERCYQLLHQVAGRAGREALDGEVIVQTLEPQSPVLRALANFDRDGFFDSENKSRRKYAWPPFARLAAIILSAQDERALAKFAHRLRNEIPKQPGVECFGPAVPLLSPLRRRHRRRFLVRATSNARLQPFLKQWLTAVVPDGSRSGVRVKIDIDPYGFL